MTEVHASEPRAVTAEVINSWADDKTGPVALHLKQELVSVEAGSHPVIFPPTYADIGYNIDELSNGTKVVTIDSVGAQANRIEPIFKEEPYSALVPQIEIIYDSEKKITILMRGIDSETRSSAASRRMKPKASTFGKLRRTPSICCSM